MPDPNIVQKSPYVLKTEAGTYFWCSCGHSRTQPYCDGSHKGRGFAPLKVDIAETKPVAWCGCKQSRNGAFCDGTHAGL